MGLLLAFWAAPFVIGGDRDEAASFFDGLMPHGAVEVVAAGVVDDSQALALKPPAHGRDLARGDDDGGLVGAADED